METRQGRLGRIPRIVAELPQLRWIVPLSLKSVARLDPHAAARCIAPQRKGVMAAPMRLVFHRPASWSCAAALALLIMLVGAAFAPGAEAHPGHGHPGLHETMPTASPATAERAKPKSSIFVMSRETARTADGGDCGNGLGSCACLACAGCCAVLGASSVPGTIVAAAMSPAPALQRVASGIGRPPDPPPPRSIR